MLFNEPKLLKLHVMERKIVVAPVSVLFNEPKLLKYGERDGRTTARSCFSALQRAEIAEISPPGSYRCKRPNVSVLFNEPKLLKLCHVRCISFVSVDVSVLFNEPKLLKSYGLYAGMSKLYVSVLFNEPKLLKSDRPAADYGLRTRFQCSSTSRNC